MPKNDAGQKEKYHSRAPARVERSSQFLRNPLLILFAIALFLSALIGLVTVADRSTELAPDYLSEVVLYALSGACLTMLIILGFLLARNVLKLWVEQRRAVPFARFRAKLVAALLGMTLIPAVLVLLVGSELIRNSADRWFSVPVDDVLTSANQIARDYYQDRERLISQHAQNIAVSFSEILIDEKSEAEISSLLEAELIARRLGRIEVYRLRDGLLSDEVLSLHSIAGVSNSTVPKNYTDGEVERLIERIVSDADESILLLPPRDGFDAVSVVALLKIPRSDDNFGVIAVTDSGAGGMAFHSQRISNAYEAYSQLRVLRRPLAAVYLSFFVMITLMILISATWLGVYVAKRITRPVQLISAGAKEIEAGHFDHRIEPQSTDEFGSLIEAFNAMAGSLLGNRRELERSQVDLEKKNEEDEQRREYIETVLERIATGVLSIDSGGYVRTINRSAMRLLSLNRSIVGLPVQEVFARDDLRPLEKVHSDVLLGESDRVGQEVALEKDGQEIHLAVAATTLPAGAVGVEGTVLVIDDVTPLIRAQRVATWRDVARRLAHEIKNPLTPIQLCAERIRKRFSSSSLDERKFIEECTSTIVGEVEGLKGLVDEFSQFARMPSPRVLPGDLNMLVREILRLYDGLFKRVTVEARLSQALPEFRFDPEQIRSVIVNLVDNAVDALEMELRVKGSAVPGIVTVGTEYDPSDKSIILTVVDNGPGIDFSDQEKVFMPYFSTKRRGSGFGLAIVRRIVVEHGGGISVKENNPSGTVFIIRLPC